MNPDPSPPMNRLGDIPRTDSLNPRGAKREWRLLLWFFSLFFWGGGGADSEGHCQHVCVCVFCVLFGVWLVGCLVFGVWCLVRLAFGSIHVLWVAAKTSFCLGFAAASAPRLREMPFHHRMVLAFPV